MKKDKVIAINVTQEQFQEWKSKANNKDITLPEFVRRAVTVYIKMLDKYENRQNNV